MTSVSSRMKESVAGSSGSTCAVVAHPRQTQLEPPLRLQAVTSTLQRLQRHDLVYPRRAGACSGGWAEVSFVCLSSIGSDRTLPASQMIGAGTHEKMRLAGILRYAKAAPDLGF